MRESERKGNCKGAVAIVEAAFVFPVMFIIVLVMIMAGEVFYQRSSVEQASHIAVIQAAAACSNPMLQNIQGNGNTIPTSPNAAKVMPYRYIFTGNMKSVCQTAEGNLRKTINEIKPLAFRGIRPRLMSLTLKPENYFLVSYVHLRCNYEIELPIRMLFTSNNFKFSYSVNITQPVGDSAEFVRNVGLVVDIMERNENIMNACTKLADGMKKVSKYLN